MKRNKQNLNYLYIALLGVFLAACVNETEIPVKPSPVQCTIHVSVLSGKEHTRASDLVEQEKINRYDIFIYNTASGDLTAYIGKTGLALTADFEEQFLTSTDYLEDQDIYVVVNNTQWEGKTESEMKAIPRATLSAPLALAGTQHYTGQQPTEMTSFGGYRKSPTENEPFVMSAKKTGYNFKSNPKLTLALSRSYAKVVVKLLASLPAADPSVADWTSLKSLYVKRLENVSSETRLFATDATGYTPATSDYAWKDGSEYTLMGNDADLLAADGFDFDTFIRDDFSLRIFPHAPALKTDRTRIGIGFRVGPEGVNRITKDFYREVEVGLEKDNYRIDPNCAYIITLRYGKTDGSLTVSTEVVPWYITHFDSVVNPN